MDKKFRETEQEREDIRTEYTTAKSRREEIEDIEKKEREEILSKDKKMK
ncbi:hypothetical protein V7O62_05945 [Methanolobus sp. ZRKC2]